MCETADVFGILHIGDRSVSRRCRKCNFSEQEMLPPLHKKVIYLDQFAFSELFKLELGLRREDAPSGEFWSNLSTAVRRVLLLQQAIFPASDIHSGETLVAKEHKLLKEALHRIGGDANFIDTRDIEFYKAGSVLMHIVTSENQFSIST